MSILPSEAQIRGPNSPSDSKSQNPNFNHGSTQLLHLSSPSPSPNQIPGLLASTAQDSGGSSKEVSEAGTPNGRKTLSRWNSDRQFRNHNHPRGRGAGSAQNKGKMSGDSVSPRSQQRAGPVASQGSSGRRAQTISGNHLLNFQYDPISRPQYRMPPPPARRQRKIRPYNKDLFLQANYKFVVLDTGDYAPESMDPDKMLQWEDIICVRYSNPLSVQCPICLEYPLCPQITSCGHIFCFPCILQYLLMGDEDYKGDCFKRCPLCFVMISSKELYTIHIENVRQHAVGDTIEFMLLTREKDSFVPSQKNKQESTTGSIDETYDPFSKFTFTSDVDLSVRKAMSDLDGWLAKADSGLVDDLEKLPYVCAAMEQLEQRKKYWNERRASGSDKASNNADGQTGFHGLQSTKIASNPSHLLNTLSPDISEQNQKLTKLTLNKPDSGSAPGQNSALGELSDCDETSLSSSYDESKSMQANETSLSSSYDESKSLQANETSLSSSYDESKSMQANETSLSSSYDESKSLQANFTGSMEIKDKDSYNFYQAIDGQHLILHPLNVKCLLHHYGSYDMLPHRISGRILQLESVTQSEAMRRRYRYLSHFSLTTTFQLCEIDLTEALPPDALSPFIDEIRKREKQRKQLANKERKEKMKAEAALVHSVPPVPSFGQSSYNDSPTFSMDDFEGNVVVCSDVALGNSPVTSSSPPNVGERRLFSNVTRLGFAAGHDSPALKIEETNALNNNEQSNGYSGVTGSRNSGSPSFANIMSRDKSGESLEARKLNEVGKKGKKPSRVLLSTSGGRRY
ncbi:hypothetical protein WN943_010395 [Citrus x changshan-huyou]